MTDPNRTSVGDVPAPYIENDDVALHKRLCQADDGANADLPAAPTLEQRLQKIIAETVIDGVAIGTKHERAAVVKYLREWDSRPVHDKLPTIRNVIDAIEKGEHLK